MALSSLKIYALLYNWCRGLPYENILASPQECIMKLINEKWVLVPP